MIRTLSIIFTCIFLYLPYIGPTTFRYDHFYTIGVFILFLVSLLYERIGIVRHLYKYFIFYACFMLLTISLMLLGSGPIIFLVKVGNSFSYPLLVMSLLMYYKKFIINNFVSIIKGFLFLDEFLCIFLAINSFPDPEGP